MAKTPPPTRSRRAKADVEREFGALRQETLADLQNADKKTAEAQRLAEVDARTAIEGVTVDTVVQDVASLGLRVGNALSDLSAQLVAEVRQLDQVRAVLALERRELERLHQIDIAATAIDMLVQDYDQRKRALDGEISAARAAWDAETSERERADKEYEDALKKLRQREAEDFDYRKAMERKKAQDKYDEEQRLVEKKNRERQDSLEKSWQEREAVLKAQEDELKQLKKEAAALPQRLNDEVARAVAETTVAVRREAEQQVQLAAKDRESESRVAELKISTLEETLARQSQQIAAQQKQVDDAKQQVQEIAVKAIEGASGARALAHVNQIAIEQAKTRSPQG